MLTASPVIAPSDAYSRRFSRPAAHSFLPSDTASTVKPAAESLHIKRILTASPVIAPSDAYNLRFSRPAAHSFLPIKHSINGKAHHRIPSY